MGLLCYTHGMKARPAKSKKRTLHQPPPEVAMGEAMRKCPRAIAKMEAARAKLEKGRYIKMPSKRPPLTEEEWFRKNWR